MKVETRRANSWHIRVANNCPVPSANFQPLSHLVTPELPKKLGISGRTKFLKLQLWSYRSLPTAIEVKITPFSALNEADFPLSFRHPALSKS